VGEREILGDAVQVRGMHGGRFAEPAEALGVLALGQMTAAGAEAQRFARSGDFKPLGHGFLGLNAFGTSHKLFKRALIIRCWRCEAREKKK
jgi:hypothetical protein